MNSSSKLYKHNGLMQTEKLCQKLFSFTSLWPSFNSIRKYKPEGLFMSKTGLQFE